MKSRAGCLKTNLSGEASYQSFYPAPLPPSPPIQLDDEMIRLLVAANQGLAMLDAFSSMVPSMSLFISMYVRKEALLSSIIEGTQCTLDDILDPELDENADCDVSDVINYIKAINYAIARMNSLPLCNRLIKETHAVLLHESRGQEKQPGAFRTSQNWIGGYGSSLRNASYIPPNADDMLEAMSDLEKYINAQDKQDPLIKAALIHYQFETIHPFLDGNGRMGRLLVILFLMKAGVLSCPVLYISLFLKMNKSEYYRRMTLVREKGDYEQWVRFFLQSVLACCEDGLSSVDRLHALHDESCLFLDNKAKHLRFLGYLEANPIIKIGKAAEQLGLSYNTVDSYIKLFLEKGILVQVSGKARNRKFAYERYLKILREGT
jgi:Fic family protein